MHAPDGKKEKVFFSRKGNNARKNYGKDLGGSGSDRSPSWPTMVESHTSCLRDVEHASELAIIYLSTLYN